MAGCELDLGRSGGVWGSVSGTAMRLVNLIPAVAAAPPGLLSALGATLFNIGNITLAGAYLLFVVSPSTTFPKVLTWLIAAAIMGVLLWISIRGLRPSVVVQTTLIVIE